MLTRNWLFLVIASSMAFAALAVGQTTKKLNNESVLKMKSAGLDDTTIVKAIESTPGDYDVSADGLIALKSGGATEAILGAILQKAQTAAAITYVAAKPMDPIPPPSVYPDELGIYAHVCDSYVELPAEIMNTRTTNALATAYSYGIKAMKINGWVTGQHSKTKFGSETTSFFLKIPEGVAPAEYVLLAFNVKGDRREVELGRARFTTRMGTEHAAVNFESEKIDKGRYKITVRNLKSGDYGFLPPGAELSKNASSVGKIYTFQVVE